MELYLTSIAAKTLYKIVPLLSKSPPELKVAFIPTAGDLYDEKPWMKADREELVSLGFQVRDIDIKGRTIDELRNNFSNIDIIFVAGGNTSYLLEKAQESGFLELTKELVSKGVIYIGSSAGSLLASPNIEVDKIYDDGEFGKTLNSYQGLGFVNFVVLPHADNPAYEPYLKRIFEQYGNKYDLRKLHDNQVMVVKNNEIQIVEA